ncbi:MAG: ATP-binding cassette domain-containing protein [Candidatus Korobacteraceae bacterium]|jgi:phospholipid/cholesterol/gamma-HCH transport system ATP-binding protein
MANEAQSDPAGDEQKHPIVFEKVSIGFEGNPVLEEISFSLEHGETKILLGVSGSGKTLILKLALGLIKPDSGRIYVLGHEITQLKEDDLFALRRMIGMVFQESALFDSLSVEENVAYRLFEEHLSYEEIHRRVIEALRFVELENTVDLYPSELSGGMRRRVAIARAIITEPHLLLYDSPTGGLDPVTSTTIIELLVKQRDVYQTSALLVTHRLQDAYLMATHHFNRQANRMETNPEGEPVDTHTRFLLLRDCRIIFQGTATELASSSDPYIRDYLS